MKGEKGLLILTPIGEVDFQALIRETYFLILSVIKEEDTQIHGIESSLLQIDELDKLLDVACIPMEDHIQFV